MKKTFLILMLGFFLIGTISCSNARPEHLEVGYSISYKNITPERMQYAKSVGIDHIEVSGLNALFDADRKLTEEKEVIFAQFKAIKEAADAAGINIWSVHMPFGKVIDLSISDEQERQAVVELHKQVLEFCSILDAEVFLFHPSYYLGLNERQIRSQQLIQSVMELDPLVRNLDAIMVVENMLGYEILKENTRESPLLRSVEETVELMGQMPETVFSAIDMNHIKYPEQLINAMGSRLKSVHIADGDGKKECHYLPCSGEGENDWNVILTELAEAGYKGPFMFECAYDDEQELVNCYQNLYDQAFTRK